MKVQSVSECLFSSEQVQKQVVSLSCPEMHLSIDMNRVAMLSKESTRKINSKMLVLREFSASVGPWLSEQSRLTYLRILSVNSLLCSFLSALYTN